jgi:TFIIF-interacting CTD phosphatase-like protein
MVDLTETLYRRPGLQDFLTAVSAKYEMHVYTMGTRAYAVQVCKLIDPEGNFFGGRILSRDESGSKHTSIPSDMNPQPMLIVDSCRHDPQEPGAAVPVRDQHGGHHRRPRRRVGRLAEPAQSDPL